MLEITSFDDAARVVYRGSRGIEILPGPETVDYIPRKWPQMLEIMSFDDAAIVVYRGVTGHRNPPETRKLWTVAHENGQKCSKS